MRDEPDYDAVLLRLMGDFTYRAAPGTVLRCFLRSVRDLRTAGVDVGLEVAAEAMTRRRLEARLASAAGAA